MDSNIVTQLVYNASLLLALSIVYEVGYIIPAKWKKATPYINGCLIGLAGIAVMTLPFKLQTGVVFDTRSILVSVTALTFGTIPAAVAAVITIGYRIFLGGVGVSMGVLVILSSAVIGLIWRHRFLHRNPKHRWLNIYVFGVAVHLTMLVCAFAMPIDTALDVLPQISLPVLLIYPVGTVVLSLLLLRQRERNEALIQIAEAQSRYTSLFNNSHAVMMLLNPGDGKIVDVNPAAEKFYGWSADTMKNMVITQVNTLTMDEIRIEMEKALTEKRNYFLFKHRRADGQAVDVEVYSGPVKLHGQTYLYSLVHDISSRVAADRALLESETRFRLLVENAPDAIFIQTGGLFAFLNNAALHMFGADSLEQLVGTPMMDRFHPDFHEIIRERAGQLSSGSKAVPPKEEIYLKLDGTPVVVDVTAVPIVYKNAKGVLVFARDITERKKLEGMKTEMEAQLRHQQKLEAIGTLAGGVAHEINNPITGIMNYAQLILDGCDGEREESRYAKEIIRETERVSMIVKNLLQFSRQEKQSHSYASIYDIINQTVSLIKMVMKKDQIVFEINLEEDLPDIKCRSQQIQQVLMNLLTNARDALNEKYPDYNENKIIRFTCIQFRQDDRRWIRIAVEDHGNGIAPQIQEKIFEPFFSTKPKEIGTGLGLSISFGIVKDHHGKLWFETKAGCYTKFILELPVDNGWSL